MTRKEKRLADRKEARIPKVERWFMKPKSDRRFKRILLVCGCRDGGIGYRGGVCSRCNKAILTHLEKIELDD